MNLCRSALIASLTMFAIAARSDGVPELPPNACYEGCTPRMEDLLRRFELQGQQPALEPSFFSGECVHLSRSYDPEHIHYAAVLIDRDPVKGTPFFATMFSFFAPEDEYASWDLARARVEMDPSWRDWGKIKVTDRALRIVVWQEPEVPAWIYWLRRDPATGNLLYITYWSGTAIISFCELVPRG